MYRESLALLHIRQQDQFDSLKTTMRDTLRELMEKDIPPKGKNEEDHPSYEIMKRSINEALDARGLETLKNLSFLSQPGVVSNAAIKLSEELFKEELELLLSLRFPAMEDREEDVSEVKASFDWIFHNPKSGDPPWDNFFPMAVRRIRSTLLDYWQSWVWQSTPMQHVYHEQRTQQALLQWASPDPLVVAAFFSRSVSSSMASTSMPVDIQILQTWTT